MNIRWLGLGLLCPLLLLCGSSPAGRAADPDAPPKVQVCQPLVREVSDYEDFSGRLEAVQSVELRARVTGYIDKVHFKPGSTVKRGDVLFEIDARPYQAQVDQAVSQITLGEVALKLALTTFDRDKALGAAVTAQQLDQDKAAVDEAKARIIASRAAADVYKLNLEFTRVTAPINGKIGRINLTAGNLVRADETVLATIVSTDPMYAAFNVDERTMLRLLRLQQARKNKGEKEMAFPVRMALADEKEFSREGKVDFAETQVNATSGTVRWRAQFPNPDGLLMPGMFVRVRLTTSAPYKAILISPKAFLVPPDIHTINGENLVYVVNEKNVIELRRVKLGASHGDLQIVLEGLKAGEWVVIDSGKKAKEGNKVIPEKVDMPGAPKEREKPKSDK